MDINLLVCVSPKNDLFVPIFLDEKPDDRHGDLVLCGENAIMLALKCAEWIDVAELNRYIGKVKNEDIQLCYQQLDNAWGVTQRIMKRQLSENDLLTPIVKSRMADLDRHPDSHEEMNFTMNSTPKLRSIFAGLDRACDKFEHYFPLYERHLVQFVGKAPRILQIGAQYGGNAEMWWKWFGPGTIIDGVDINPLCEETEYLKLYVGDQGSDDFWKSTFGNRVNHYDIIIDDGSHDNPHQITTLINTYGLLKDGGVFWCEDTHTSYYYQVRVRDGGYGNPNSFISFRAS